MRVLSIIFTHALRVYEYNADVYDWIRNRPNRLCYRPSGKSLNCKVYW